MKTKTLSLVTLAIPIGGLFYGCAFTHPSEAVRRAQDQIAEAETIWKLASVDTYDFTVKYSTFLLPYGCTVQSFRVVNNRPQPLASPECESNPDVLGTVPALFQLARNELNSQPDEVSISFNLEIGYPTKFYSGSASIEDAFFRFEILQFESRNSGP